MNKCERFGCCHFIEKNGYAYFSNVFYNGLFRVELKTGKTFFLGSFVNEKRDERNIHKESLKQGNLLYFFPRRGRHVHVFSLIDHSITAIEIRKVYEQFFRIDEVILKDANVIFLPLEKGAPIKKLDLITQDVTEIKEAVEISTGIYMSQNRAEIPTTVLYKHHIKQVPGFFWQQVSDGKWCTFWPSGKYLLCYTPETEAFESIPLNIVNRKELYTYAKSIQQPNLKTSWFVENKPLSLQAYSYMVMRQLNDEFNEYKNNQFFFAGDSIWKYVKK